MYGRRVLVLSALMLSFCILAGCGRKGEDVAASVNGKKILVSEFEEKLRQMPAFFQQNEAQRRKFLESLIDREVLLAETARRKLTNDEAVKKRLKLALEQISIEELVKKAIPEAAVTDQELKDFYQEKKEQFVEREKVQVSQILVRSEKEAREILKQLKGGKDFAGLARTKSISPDASRGGDIGYFGRAEMLPEFEEAAFSLKKGQISKVIKSPFGYHILKLTDRKNKQQKSFAEAKEEIEAIVRQKKQRESLDKWFKDLKGQAKIKINEDIFAQKPGEKTQEAEGVAEGKKE
ncbi:MAG: peptidyl-prolyl cis-trans isomerase [Candidatus Ratteibacteria bacterium]|nr:peptidyl-prolyl cis-trans isomerase [Candidatus Ratteibacteria bacterium]